jgi:hypothetical protein
VRFPAKPPASTGRHIKRRNASERAPEHCEEPSPPPAASSMRGRSETTKSLR